MIKNYKVSQYTLYLSLISISLAELNLDNIDTVKNWKTLQDKEIIIRWTNFGGYPICQARTTINGSVKDISSIIEDVKNYPNIFKRIQKTKQLNDNIVHIMLGMPLFLSDRDYVIQYKKNKSENNWKLSFNAIIHPEAPESKNYVRLVNAAGLWELKPKESNETLISYTWNGQLLGDFPSFALERAWKTQGNEIMHWINDALD